MKKIKMVRNVSCFETIDYINEKQEKVKLWVADMIDGSHYYTSVGGNTIFGTDEEITPQTDIIDLHDFKIISVLKPIKTERVFIAIVEEKAYIDETKPQQP